MFPIPLGVNWHEGMLLSQQHFQQMDMRNFQTLAHQLRLLSSHHYGVCFLRIDNVALPDGLYRINEIEAVFPDGFILNYAMNSVKGLTPLEINVAPKMESGLTEVTVFLCLAEVQEGVSPILGNPARFYTIESEQIADMNIPDNSIKVPLLFPNAFLHIGDTLPEACTGFPLCKIIRRDGVFHVKNWTPPCFFIEKHFPMWRRCSKLAMDIREKATFLSEKLKNEVNKTVYTDTANMLNQFLQILPNLESLVYSSHMRPYDLYLELSEVLGAVSVLIPTDMIPVMAPYNHNDIDKSIYTIVSLIEHYISAVERGFSILPFNKKDRFFYHYISKNDLDGGQDGKLYVGLKSKQVYSYSGVEKWMNDAVIVSDSFINAVRTNRVKGAARSIIKEEVISQIMPGNGVMLFEVDINKEFIKPNENLHIFNPGDTPDTRPSDVLMYLPRANSK